MVDFRPLLFINALALMLLVTAGFASIRQDITSANVTTLAQAPLLKQSSETEHSSGLETPISQRQTPAPTTELSGAEPTGTRPATLQTTASFVPSQPAEPPTITPMPEEPELLAMAEPVSALSTRRPAPQSEPTPPELPTTGTLVLRSNVVDDRVTINGQEYGATRLALKLAPGNYDVLIEKPGHQSWSQSVTLEAGDTLTLVGKLEAYTRVSYNNGEWLGGVKTGDGTWQGETGLRYEGEFVDGEFHGHGTAWYPDGGRYEGDWKQGSRHGEGLWRSPDSTTYTGQFQHDQFQGKGTLTLPEGDILTGTWDQGQLNGHGSLTTADGMLYVGGFRSGEFHGQGALTYPDGRSYEGEFSNGEFHGKGSEVFADGKKYDGQYMEGRFHGKGLLRNPNGSAIEANFRYGEPYGQVRLTTAAGEVFTARTTEPGVCYREKSYRATQCPVLEGW